MELVLEVPLSVQSEMMPCVAVPWGGSELRFRIWILPPVLGLLVINTKYRL